MARRIAHAEWTGELGNGTGEVRIAGESLALAYTPAWLQEGAGTNAEELLAAAHAASFAMALQAAFASAGRRVQVVRVRAELHLDRREGTWTITRSDLESEVSVAKDPRARDMFESEFQRIVQEAAATCPVSRALAGLEITVDAVPAGSPATEIGPVDPPAGERDDGRRRRALEGRLVSRMRTQARQRSRP
jgi:osmotically inducible protein OsmC